MVDHVGRFVLNRLLRVTCALLIVSPVIHLAKADIMNLRFSGTYDTEGETFFGLSGSAVPFVYTMTYDTSLNTTSMIIPAGAVIAGSTMAESFYAYSASGITALNLTFGSQSWTVADISPRTPAVGYSADLWFDTDLSTAVPSAICLLVDDGSYFLQLGGSAGDIDGVKFQRRSVIENSQDMIASDSMDIAAVPEPKSCAMLITTIALVGLAALVRQRTHCRT